MRDQVYNKKTSMSDHVQILETLREEITIMTERKMDLERRIEALYAEREGLSTTLDESADRIVMLEKEARERDCLIRNIKKETDELKSQNMALNDRLDSVYRSSSISPQGNLSILNEMEISDSEKSLNGSRRPFSNVDEDLDDIECDNPESPVGLQELKGEVLSVYQQLRNMCGILRQRGKQRSRSTDSLDTTSSSEEPQVNHVKAGLLLDVMQELKGLLRMSWRRPLSSCITSRRSPALTWFTCGSSLELVVSRLSVDLLLCLPLCLRMPHMFLSCWYTDRTSPFSSCRPTGLSGLSHSMSSRSSSTLLNGLLEPLRLFSESEISISLRIDRLP